VDRSTGRCFAVTILCLVVAACSSQSSPSAQQSNDAQQGAAEPEGLPTPLDGTYASGEYILRLNAGKWSVNLPARDGDFRIEEDELILYNEDGCPGVGTYGWALEDEVLTLSKVEDLCVQRDVRFPSVQKWSAVTTLGEPIEAGDGLLLFDEQHVANYFGEEDVIGRAETIVEVSTTTRYGLVFSPTVLIGSPGQTIVLTLKNPDRKGTANEQHNFNIDELGISHVEVPYGEEAVVTITFPDSGGLRFYCAYHVRFGQQGELLVR
jgi:plastocyanin